MGKNLNEFKEIVIKTFNVLQTAGSPLEVLQLSRNYLIGFVSELVSSSCSKVSLVTKVSQAISWITAVCTEAVPVRTVS